jgi:tetratricopeptide (TPR) repeat protein
MKIFNIIVISLIRILAYSNNIYSEKEYLVASEYFNKSMFDSSAVHFNKYLIENDTSLSALKLLGLCNYNLTNYQKGIDIFSKAISIRPDDASLYNYRGSCYLKLMKYNFATTDFNKAIKLQPDYAAAYNNKAICIYRNQDIAKASIADLKECELNFSKALEFDSSLVSIYKNRGIVRYYLAEYKKSEEDLIKAYHNNEKDVNVQYYLSRGLLDNRKYKEALDCYTNLINIAGVVQIYYLERADCYLQLNQLENAKIDIDKAKSLPKCDLALIEYYYAKLSAAQKNKKELITHLKSAEKLGLFNDKSYFTKIAKDNHFRFYEKDKDFYEYIQKIKFK